MIDLLGLMWVPFLMCLVLTGIHAYLGLHVIAREVVFVDIGIADPGLEVGTEHLRVNQILVKRNRRTF